MVVQTHTPLLRRRKQGGESLFLAAFKTCSERDFLPFPTGFHTEKVDDERSHLEECHILLLPAMVIDPFHIDPVLIEWGKSERMAKKDHANHNLECKRSAGSIS
jgi:hypothetical protein